MDVDIQIAPGITILFGPSGAGKSTLLDCIAGLLKPQEARITLGGRVLQDSASQVFLRAQERRIAYLFQSPALFPHMTVEENAGFALRDVRDARQKASGSLFKFGVAHLAGRKPGEISGGEAQRVALARALAPSPCAVLLDEPLKGLQAELKSSILDDLRLWNRSKPVPILYVTHQRDEVDALGERAITIDRGRVVSEGIPHAVLAAPRTKRLARAAGFENHLKAIVQELREANGVMRVRLTGSDCELELPLGYTAVGDRINVAIRAGDILLATQKPAGLSARNILEGAVESFEVRGATVVCRVNVGAIFLVHVTPGALRTLQQRHLLVAGDQDPFLPAGLTNKPGADCHPGSGVSPAAAAGEATLGRNRVEECCSVWGSQTGHVVPTRCHRER
jgi:molybdate transport system ATP-binding protein